MSTYKLTYFNAWGRAELARILMAYGGIEYEDVRIEGAQWPELKPKTPYGALPTLEVEGECICQSNAIYRFLAKKVGLTVESALEEAKVDMINECLAEYSRPLPPIYAPGPVEIKNERKKKYKETLPAETAKLEKLLKGDYFVGNKMTLADINAASVLDTIHMTGIKLNMDDFPKLKALYEKVFAEPKIAAWIKNRPETAF